MSYLTAWSFVRMHLPVYVTVARAADCSCPAHCGRWENQVKETHTLILEVLWLCSLVKSHTVSRLFIITGLLCILQVASKFGGKKSQKKSTKTDCCGFIFNFSLLFPCIWYFQGKKKRRGLSSVAIHLGESPASTQAAVLASMRLTYVNMMTSFIIITSSCNLDVKHRKQLRTKWKSFTSE